MLKKSWQNGLIKVLWSGIHCLRETDILSRERTDKIVFAHFQRGLLLKRKQIAPLVSKFFSFRVDPFS